MSILHASRPVAAALVLLAGLASQGPVQAQPAPGAAPAAHRDGPPPHRRPPREALQACASLGSGADCSFRSPRGETVTGHCWAPEGRPLACRPHDAPPPPPEGAASQPPRR